MNTELEFSQFVHSNTIGGDNAQIVAYTKDLNLSRCKTIQEKSGTFFKLSSRDEHGIGIGIFPEDNYLVLVQASLAFDPHKQLALDFTGRSFSQYQYILIPIDLIIKNLQGQTFQLIDWIANQHFEALSNKQEGNFEFMQIPLFKQSPTESSDLKEYEGEVSKIQSCLKETDSQGRSFLLMTIAALLNKLRVLIDDEDVPSGVPFSDYLESILLLLPAKLRIQIAIAMGELDEHQCEWAQLIIKLNGYPSRLPEKLIWLNRRTNEFVGQDIDQKKFEHPFVDDILASIITDEDKLRKLLKINDLGTIKELTSLEIIFNFIPILPKEQQKQKYNEYLERVKKLPQWEKIIAHFREEGIDLKLALHKFAIKLKDLDQSSSKSSKDYYEFIVKVLGNLPEQDKRDLTNQFLQDTSLSEILLNYGLHRENSLLKDVELEEIVRRACLNVIADKSSHISWQEAYKFSKKIKLKENNLFKETQARFNIVNSIVQGKIENKELFIKFFADEFIPLLFEINSITNTNLYKKAKNLSPRIADLLESIVENKSFDGKNLPQLARLASLTEQQEDCLYLNFLESQYSSSEKYCSLLSEILEQKLSADNQFSQKPLSKTFNWFDRWNNQLSKIFSNFEETTENWSNWYALARFLFKEPIDYIKYLDRKVGKLFWIEILKISLDLGINNSRVQEYLLNSSSWKNFLLKNLNERKLDPRLVGYVSHIVLYLRESGNCNLINGELFHYLSNSWLHQKHKHIDETLWSLVTSNSVTEAFVTNDWLKLQHIAWELSSELELPISRPPLTESEKKELKNMAMTVAQKLDSQPGQTRKILLDCGKWGLNLAEQKEILRSTNKKARDLDLVLEYIFRDIQTLDKIRDIPFLFSELRQLSNDSLINLLKNRFTQNLSLTAILFHHGLHCQSFVTENTEVLSEIRTLSKRVIENKSPNNWTEAWELLTQFRNSNLFEDKNEYLNLLNMAKPENKEDWLEYASTITQFYTQPDQTERLLSDCDTWGLSLSEKKEILKKTYPKKAYSISLLLEDYIDCNSKFIELEHDRKLLNMLFCIEPRNEKETTDLKNFFSRIFGEFISSNNVDDFQRLKNKINNQQIYQDAFTQAIRNFIFSSTENLNLSQLKKYYIQLKQSQLLEECKLLKKILIEQVEYHFN